MILVGLFLAGKVPVSLLPNMEVPKIIIKVHSPGSSARFIEQNSCRRIRESLLSVKGLNDLNSRTGDAYALLDLSFEFGTNMQEAYMEVNERIDHLLPDLPSDVPRPDVTRSYPTDIPAIRIQVTPIMEQDFIEASNLADKIVKGRLAGLPGVATIDINGTATGFVGIAVREQALNALHLQRADIEKAIANAVPTTGDLQVADGQYSYFVRLRDPLTKSEDIARLPVELQNGGVVQLNQVATIKTDIEKEQGCHLFNGSRSIVLTVQKQPDAKMNELLTTVTSLVNDCNTDYPKVRFALTRDQSFIIEAGVSNLYQDVIIGGLLTIAVLFLFLGSFIPPFLMAISIPISLAITLVFFYLFDISFNIISLSGLALGIGMLIDNSIVVIDSISRKKNSIRDIVNAAVEGTNEVLVPVTSQVLTTVAVYAPLILLDGMASKLIFDQSIALTISLVVSLAVAFILTPLLYRWLSKWGIGGQNKDTALYVWLAERYHRMVDQILQKKKFYMMATLAFMAAGFLLAWFIPVRTLPRIEETKSLTSIEWDDPIDVGENLKRNRAILQLIQGQVTLTESDIGISQYASQPQNGDLQSSEIYFECGSEAKKLTVNAIISRWMQAKHPYSYFNIEDAPNGFTQVFVNSLPWLEARIRRPDDDYANTGDATLVIRQLEAWGFTPGKGLLQEKRLTVALDYDQAAIYGIDPTTIEQALSTLYGKHAIPGTGVAGVAALQLRDDQPFLSATVRSRSGAIYPLRKLLKFQYTGEPKIITADKNGRYISLQYDKVSDGPLLKRKVQTLASHYRIPVDIVGQFLESSSRIWTMVKIFGIVLFLLYVILAYEYEDLLQPLIVMLTIPLGVSGALILLYLSGGTLDVMALIGLIVVLGLIVDDPILKVETLNRLTKKYQAQGVRFDEQLLKTIIHEAGDICLKPLLMVSLTTSVAMIPVFFVGGIGNDLQKPLALVIIGGLTLGTFFTTWLIPLSYWYLIKLRKSGKQI